MHTDDLAATALRQLFIKPLKGAQTSHLGALCVPDSFSSSLCRVFFFFSFLEGQGREGEYRSKNKSEAMKREKTVRPGQQAEASCWSASRAEKKLINCGSGSCWD